MREKRKKERAYVVMMWAPVSFRVLASSRKQAKSRALACTPTESGQLLHARVEEDTEDRWMEAVPWRIAEEDGEGGVYLAEGSIVINPNTAEVKWSK